MEIIALSRTEANSRFQNSLFMVKMQLPRKGHSQETQLSRKHAYIMLTTYNPVIIELNWDLQGYTLFFLLLLKNIDCGTR